MASGWYVTGQQECDSAVIDLENDTLKIMLVDDNYVYDPDHDVVDNGGDDGTDPSYNELVATGYTGGFEGAGRLEVTVEIEADKTNNRSNYVFSMASGWEAVGGAVNGTIGGAILIKEGTSDTDSRLIMFFDVADTPTNGSPVVLTFGAAGTGNAQKPVA